MYVITEWLERYEVNDKGQPAKDGDKLRVRPLDYIRSKVHGRARGAGFSAMARLAGSRKWEVFGIFQKFLEIAGCENHDKRGRLLNARGNPATDDDLAFILEIPVEDVQFTIQVLTNKEVGWVKDIPFQIFQEFQESQVSSNFQNFQEFQEPYITKVEVERNETEENRIERNETYARTREDEGQQDEIPQINKAQDSTISHSNSLSTRLDFLNELRRLLKCHGASDEKAVGNFERWLYAQNSGMAEKALQIARDSQNGRKPIAVFFTRAEDELGYRAKAERDKRK